MTIRNYRQISKTDTTGVAMGGARCRAVRDRIIFRITISRFNVTDRIPILLDSISFNYGASAPSFILHEEIGNVIDNIDYQEE